MKKAKYTGDFPVVLTTIGVYAEPGDVVDVPDWWNNPQFVDQKTQRGGDVTNATIE